MIQEHDDGARMPSLSVVIPALNARRDLGATLASLGEGVEVVVSDGGSSDGTRDIARRAGARVVMGPRGRGGQIARGVAEAGGDWLLLLHADTVLEPGWRAAAAGAMAGGEDRAFYFRFALDSADPRARRLERVVAWRCRRLGLPYGDQGLLISRRLLERVGGVRPLVLMEDVELARRIGRHRLAALDVRAVTSASRWERDGWTMRSARNLMCLGLYCAGVPARFIMPLYRSGSSR
jgi:rSAM/selenodomain-associated transferase 2